MVRNDSLREIAEKLVHEITAAYDQLKAERDRMEQLWREACVAGEELKAEAHRQEMRAEEYLREDKFMSDDKYPLCRAAGMKVNKEVGFVDVRKEIIDEQFYIYADDVERWLEKAPVVFGPDSKDFFQTFRGCATHTARMVLIEPITRETAESFREFLRNTELRDRAKKLLDGDKR